MPPFPADGSMRLDGPSGAPTVYLLDAATSLERRMLQRWLARDIGPAAEAIAIPSSRRRRRGGHPHTLAKRMDRADDPFFLPLRVVWMAPAHGDRRAVGWSDIFKPGDPRDPRGLRAHVTRLTRPSRVKLLAGEGAFKSALAERLEQADEVEGLAPFIVRRAWRTLDVAERKLRGNRYKIPRFVPEAILSRRRFVDSVDELAAESGTDPKAARAKAGRYLREIAATHSPYVIDLIANLIHLLYRQGYGEIKYLSEQVERLGEIGHANPLVFLPSHRSHLDRLSLQFMLWENDLPPNHTAGGINLDFFPVGPLMRRTGVFFIRRSFRDNRLYKLVLSAYIDFLVEKRFPLEWYMEGGRSRSGKLLPPRFGLLQYVVGALRRGMADDVLLLPVSITYDQIHDLPDYAREALGRAKEKESLSWLVRTVSSLRRRYGDIHIRFGEPVSVSAVLDLVDEDAEESIGLQKVAFDVMHRIAGSTPVTPIAVVSIALLAARGRAQTAAELAVDCGRLMGFIRKRSIATTEEVDLSDPDLVAGAMEWLSEHGAVSSHEAVGRKVYWLDDQQMVQLSYYRNVVVHYFVPRATGEVALAVTAEKGGDQETFDAELLALRDLLKFEFFFAEREAFLDEVHGDLRVDDPDWAARLASDGAEEVLMRLGEPLANWALLPFLDAYQVVGDELESLEGDVDEKQFLKACLARARMYRLEGRVISGESVSQVLFKSALALADNRSLLDSGTAVAEPRTEFANEVRVARGHAARGL